MLPHAGANTGICVYFVTTTAALGYILHSHGALPLVREVLLGQSKSSVEQGADTWMQLGRVLAASDLSVFLVLNWLFAATCMFVLLTTAVFLGRLTDRESALLVDRLIKYFAFKLMFISAFRAPTLEETAEWITWFVVAGFMRFFIGMGRDRLEALMAAPAAPVSSHLRALSLVGLILLRNCQAIKHLWGGSSGSVKTDTVSLAAAAPADNGSSLGGVAAALGVSGVTQVVAAATLHEAGRAPSAAATGSSNVSRAATATYAGGGVSRMVLCAYDLAIIQLEATKTLLKYGVYLAEVWSTRRALAGHNDLFAGGFPAALHDTAGAYGFWDGNMGVLLYHVELIADVVMHGMTIAHYLHLWCLHGFTLHVVDMVLLMDVRAVAASLYRRLKQFTEYRTATHRLHHAFPDARLRGEEEACSICMETMQVAKQLPCGHHFHLACLRAWLQQSGAHTFNCPNCRQPLLVQPPAQRRPPNFVDRMRQYINRQITQILIRLVRWMLEADRAIMQWSLRAQLRAEQLPYPEHHRHGGSGRDRNRSRNRAGARAQQLAHEEPEGSGESSHPAPVSRAEKLMRRVRGLWMGPWRAVMQHWRQQQPHGGAQRRWWQGGWFRPAVRAAGAAGYEQAVAAGGVLADQAELEQEQLDELLDTELMRLEQAADMSPSQYEWLVVTDSDDEEVDAVTESDSDSEDDEGWGTEAQPLHEEGVLGLHEDLTSPVEQAAGARHGPHNGGPMGIGDLSLGQLPQGEYGLRLRQRMTSGQAGPSSRPPLPPTGTTQLRNPARAGTGLQEALRGRISPSMAGTFHAVHDRPGSMQAGYSHLPSQAGPSQPSQCPSTHMGHMHQHTGGLPSHAQRTFGLQASTGHGAGQHRLGADGVHGAGGGDGDGVGGRQRQYPHRPSRRAVRRAVQQLGGPSGEVPTFSAGVVHQVVQMTQSALRSSLARGDSRAAVAAGSRGDGEEEVCSRPVQAAHT